jgi:hypothetical protein
MQLTVAHAHMITSGTTTQHHHKCEVDGASILLTKKLEQLQRATCRQFQCLHFSTAVSLEDFLVFLLEMADYISGASS